MTGLNVGIPSDSKTLVGKSLTHERAMLADIQEELTGLHRKIDATLYEVQQLTAALEELLPAARRAVKMMEGSKTVKVMELLKRGKS